MQEIARRTRLTWGPCKRLTGGSIRMLSGDPFGLEAELPRADPGTLKRVDSEPIRT